MIAMAMISAGSASNVSDCISQPQQRRFISISATAAKEIMETAKLDIPVLSLPEIMTRFQSYTHTEQGSYKAMYSSVIGAITKEPAAMVITIDDHMVHRGHGVFDTAFIANGHLYELDAHLDRFHRSAAAAKITPPFDRATMRDILIQTVAKSNCRQGSIRYWLSAGPGGFGLSSSECPLAALYAIVIDSDELFYPETGVKVVTSTIPIKHPQFATMKNVNYLPNVLSKLEAESKGAVAGIWLDEEGFVAEGPNMNVAFVSKAGELLVPSFDNILAGCTARRMLALAPKLLKGGDGEGIIAAIKVKKISLEEAKDCSEMMLIGSAMPISPVVEWDGVAIGNGEGGEITLALRRLLIDDILSGPSEVRVPVSYIE